MPRHSADTQRGLHATESDCVNGRQTRMNIQQLQSDVCHVAAERGEKADKAERRKVTFRVRRWLHHAVKMNAVHGQADDLAP